MTETRSAVEPMTEEQLQEIASHAQLMMREGDDMGVTVYELIAEVRRLRAERDEARCAAVFMYREFEHAWSCEPCDVARVDLLVSQHTWLDVETG